MKLTAVLVLTCLVVASLGVDPYTYGFVPAHPTVTGAFGSMFLHDPSNPWHLWGNMIALAIFGTLVERDIGSLRFGILYFGAGLGGIAGHMLCSTTTLVGASGALFGVMAACAMLRPRLAGFVVAYAAWNIWQLFSGTGGSVAVGCHVGGFVVGFVIVRGLFAKTLVEARS